MMSLFSAEIKARFLLLVQLALILSSVTWATMASFWLSFVFPIAFALSGAVMASSRKWFYSYLFFSGLAFVFGHVGKGGGAGFLQLACLSVSFYLLFREIVRHSFLKPDTPRADRVLAGVAGYLALGLFWFLWGVVAVRIDGTAFMNQATPSIPTLSDQLYFSFVTLTTLGYGDIVPVSPFAKVVVIFTALSGVLYLAVFISALIGAASSSGRE